MAWDRKTSDTKIGGSSLYAYTEVDWNEGSSRCTYTHIGGCYSPYGGWENSPSGTLYWREWDWNEDEWGVWHEYGSGTKRYYGPGDLELVKLENQSFTRFDYDREVELDCDVYAVTDTGSGTGYAKLRYIVPHTAGQVTNLSATLESDSQIRLSWVNPSTSYDAFSLEVSIDNTSWSQCWYYDGAGYPTSYMYSASAGHSYKFRARVVYKRNWGAYSSATSTITMAPLPPTSITVRASSGTTVNVTLENNSSVATKVQYQVSQGGVFPDESSVQESVNLTSFQTSVAGSEKIRVRNWNTTGVSAWLVSQTVTTICPPNNPSLNSLSPQGPVNIDNGPITFVWGYSAPDNSDQTSAKITFSTDNGLTWSTPTELLQSTQTYVLSPIPWAAGTTVKWKVMVKGADSTHGTNNDGYSDYSEAATFTVYQVPTVTFVANKPPSTVSSLPIPIEATYTDPQGLACNNAYVSVAGITKRLTINGSSLSTSLTAADFTDALPENGRTYTVTVTASSRSGLDGSNSTPFEVSYTPPKIAEVNITYNEDTGYVSLKVSVPEEQDANLAEIDRIDVFRVTDKRRELATNVADGSGLTDKYAPLNITYHYEVVTYAQSGAYYANSIEAMFVTRNQYIYWGDKLVSVPYTRGGDKFEYRTPNKKRVHYTGRKKAVSYDDGSIDVDASVVFQVFEMETADLFEQLMYEGARGIVKTLHGKVFRADFENTHADANGKYYNALETFKAHMIDGAEL